MWCKEWMEGWDGKGSEEDHKVLICMGWKYKKRSMKGRCKRNGECESAVHTLPTQSAEQQE